MRCYTLDENTGIKKEHEFWIDKDLCREIYLGEGIDNEGDGD